jgi:hypothetical protein
MMVIVVVVVMILHNYIEDIIQMCHMQLHYEHESPHVEAG